MIPGLILPNVDALPPYPNRKRLPKSFNVKELNSLIELWGREPAPYSSMRPSVRDMEAGLLCFALARNEAEFKPNMYDVNELLSAIGSPVRLFEYCGLHTHYSTYKSALYRWREAKKVYLNAVQHGRQCSDKRLKCVQTVATKWVSYRDWLTILDRVGVLNESLIASVKDRAIRERLMGMKAVYASLPPLSDNEINARSRRPNLIGQGGGDAFQQFNSAWLANADFVNRDDQNCSAAMNKGENGVFVNQDIQNVSVDFSKGMFINCTFRRSTIRFNSDVIFIACKFQNCTFAKSVFELNRISFKGCAGKINFSRRVMRDVNFADCDNLIVNVQGCHISGGVVSNSWIECESTGSTMPSVLSGAVWINGGLNFKADSKDSEVLNMMLHCIRKAYTGKCDQIRRQGETDTAGRIWANGGTTREACYYL